MIYLLLRKNKKYVKYVPVNLKLMLEAVFVWIHKVESDHHKQMKWISPALTDGVDQTSTEEGDQTSTDRWSGSDQHR